MEIKIFDALSSGVICKSENSNEIHFGAGWDEIKEVVQKFNPDAVGITSQFTSQVSGVIKTAGIVRNINDKIPVIIGGPHASIMPETFLDGNNLADIVVRGEGEQVFAVALDRIMHGLSFDGVPGIMYKENGKIIQNAPSVFIENLDELTFPAYELVDLEEYFKCYEKGLSGRVAYKYPGSERAVSMITSRGCPFDCVFCSIHLSMGRKHRVHSSDYVAKHIKYVVEKYGVKHIHFEDDNLTLDTERFESILDKLIENNVKFTWDTPNGIRADSLNKRILEKCKQTGCSYLRIGIESADEYVCNKIIRKKLNFDKIIEFIKNCQDTGIDLEAFYIIGFPGENIEQMKKTIDFAIQLQEEFNVFPYDVFTATPLPGTDLYKTCLNKGYLTRQLSLVDFATITQSKGVIKTEDFSPEDILSLKEIFKRKIKKAWKKAYIKFILKKPLFLVEFIMSVFKKLNKHTFKQAVKESLNLRFKNCVLRGLGK
ncbi:MAG: radical SAM protein [Armatimonadota bacterium]